MQHTTRWSPDTCKCVLEYTWDDAQDENSRVHTPSNVIKACSFHIGLSLADHYKAVKGENMRKNILHGKILGGVPSVAQDVIQVDGSVIKEFKPGKRYDWAYAVDRVLEVTLAGFTVAEKEAAQTLIDTVFPKQVRIT